MSSGGEGGRVSNEWKEGHGWRLLDVQYSAKKIIIERSKTGSG